MLPESQYAIDGDDSLLVFCCLLHCFHHYFHFSISPFSIFIFILFCVILAGVLGFEPRSKASHTLVISTTFTRPCSRLKPVRVPGVEPGSRGSKPLMLSVTPHPHEAGDFVAKTPPGSEPREGEDAGLQGVECTLIGSNSSAKTIPPTELFYVHLLTFTLQQSTTDSGAIKRYRYIPCNLGNIWWKLISHHIMVITRRVTYEY
jgi:hypothetical protein